jgi:Superfamily II DNA/RNA helicases, SNF2 family
VEKFIYGNDFIITSFGILKNDIEFLSQIQFKAIFVDEAQNIKNPATQVSKAVKLLKSPFRLAMTGTPIENHIQDLWNIFDFVMPKYLGNKSSFEIEMKEGNRSLIRTKIRPFVLRREKKEVLASLPEKTEITLKCQMSDAQRNLYQTVLNAAKQGATNAKGKHERLNILTALLKLRQVCIHPGLLSEFQHNDIESAKFELAKEKIQELIQEDHKIVLFSQFTEMLNIMEKWTNSEGINSLRIDGSVSAKARMVAVEKVSNHRYPYYIPYLT